MRLTLIPWAACWAAAAVFAEDPSALQKSIKDLEVEGSWIYNDLAQGFAEAGKTKKPLLLTFR